jgi:predicted dinucleotide-binding enzyme
MLTAAGFSPAKNTLSKQDREYGTTITNEFMQRMLVEPSLVPGDHSLFICGNDAAAKREVTDRLCEWFGWKSSNIIDLGDVSGSRGMEMWMPIWLRLYGKIGHPHFNLRLIVLNK